MRIALLISGRITRYEVCLLKLLITSHAINIDLFMSINDENENCEYFTTMKNRLSPWLKSCTINKFKIPEETALLFDPNENICNSMSNINLQKINGKNLPYNCLSMYYNDNISFKMASSYADSKNFEYDYYMKYRSDIINNILPTNIDLNPSLLYCATPQCNFTSNGIFKKPIINDSFAWGKRQIMAVYCNTYDYVIKKNREHNGKYYIAGECSLTDNIYENSINVSYVNIKYFLERNRRMFDIDLVDTRLSIPSQQFLLKITDKDSTKYIKEEKQ